ncbi:MAG: nucleotidyl transferase AbiEii/AbiGii toxin family protein [Nitrospirae bacterium]|nr:nucleotidyl transferase AbiEii/AbiGii toxin family protein [Nitrospirota bacterium]
MDSELKIHRESLSENGWSVLKSLKHTLKKHDAILAGGTALALRMGHRISADLDFFTEEDFRTESIITEIKKTKQQFQVFSEGEEYLVAEIGGIKFSLFKYDYPFLEKTFVYEGVQIADILDIASMKVIAISQRGTKRDFLDLYFILQKIPFHKIARHMVRRFGKERISSVHIGKSLVYFSDADSQPEPEYGKGKAVNWERVKKFFKSHVRQFVFDLEAALKEDE